METRKLFLGGGWTVLPFGSARRACAAEKSWEKGRQLTGHGGKMEWAEVTWMGKVQQYGKMKSIGKGNGNRQEKKIAVTFHVITAYISF